MYNNVKVFTVTLINLLHLCWVKVFIFSQNVNITNPKHLNVSAFAVDIQYAYCLNSLSNKEWWGQLQDILIFQTEKNRTQTKIKLEICGFQTTYNWLDEIFVCFVPVHTTTTKNHNQQTIAWDDCLSIVTFTIVHGIFTCEIQSFQSESTQYGISLDGEIYTLQQVQVLTNRELLG